MATSRILAADTSFLLSLLGTDSNTRDAVAVVKDLSCPLSLSSINDLELLNASRMAEFQGFKEPGSSALMETLLKTERIAGRLVY